VTTGGGEDLAVDILIDNFNYGRFLTDAIESARSQTHDRIRVIVVDDGSSDESRMLLREYEGRAGMSVVLKENGGQASAINAGMERSEGDVVIVLDADDRLHPEAAAHAAAAFAADASVAKVQSRMDVIDADGVPTGEVTPAPHMPLPNGDLRSAELAYPFDIPWMATSANAFRRSALLRILPIPERDYPACADWYLVHLTALLGRVVSLDKVLASYRVHGANAYRPQAAEVDLAHIRATIGYARSTASALLALAEDLDLPHPDRILSIADLANRMISLRLEPDLHPLDGDRLRLLTADAVRAARRRGNASAAMKLIFVCWFGAMAIAPRPLARQLANLFFFPRRRRFLNRFLGRQQEAPGAPAAAGG
jgi:glycosyltransferase involved in cell wall biosynthesis